jgi:hypothetical protein
MEERHRYSSTRTTLMEKWEARRSAGVFAWVCLKGNDTTRVGDATFSRKAASP